MWLPNWSGTTYPIGVAVGSSGVDLLQLHSGRSGWQVIAAARAFYRESLPSDNVSLRANLIRHAVHDALGKGSFQGSDCVSSLSVSDLKIRAVRLPKMPDDELSKAVVFEAADRFELDVEDIEVDWVRAGEVAQGDSVRDEIILVAVPRDVVAAHLDTLISCKLRPIAVDVPFAASVRILNRKLRRGADKKTVRMIIDIGELGSTVTLTRGNELAFIKVVNIGGAHLTHAVAESLNLDETAAADIRRRRIIAEDQRSFETDNSEAKPDRSERVIYEAVRPMLHRLAQEAALCLRYYSVTFRGVRPESILVSGSAASEPHLVSILGDEMKITASVSEPFSGIDISQVQLDRERRSARFAGWSTAVGLSMRGRIGTLAQSATKRMPNYDADYVEREAA